MLLPSDVARLVLGYLQEEGLSATSQAFIHESPNLKEYAEHTTGDGTIPACVFSIFGKSLTTILNEYVAAKTKESCHEVPVMMTSLWKKLDFTLNQINCQTVPQHSGFICNLFTYQPLCVAARSRVGLANMARQRVLAVASAGAVVCSSVSETSTIISPAHTSHSMLAHSTPVCYSGPNKKLLYCIRNDMLSVSSHSLQQLVIQNARDKILGDRSLQEKLAENINKILANEPMPQTSKGSSSTVETDQSIDEILGLQGEIHMSDDAIHDILEQTESDPAFQALFDLFDCSNYDLIYFNVDSPASDTTPMKTKPGQERKTRKSAPPTLLKKTVLGPSGRSSRIENSSARLIVSQGDPRGVSSAPTNSNRKEKDPLFTNTVSETPMDIDEPLNTPPPPPLDSLATQEPPAKDSTSFSPVFGESSTDPSPVDSGAFPEPEETSASNTNNQKEPKQSQEFKDQPGAPGASSLPPEQAQLNITPAPAADLPQILLSNSGGDTLPVSTFSVISKSVLKTSSSTDTTASAASPSSAFIAAPSTATPAAPTSASTSASPRAAHASFTAASPASSSSSCALVAPPPAASVATTADLLTTSIPNTAATDSSNVMSLKIIISDNQDEGSSSDTALNQAISSISGDKIPTIYVSSPAKSVGCPETPKANMDEVAQAVSGLQSSEAFASPLSSKAGAVTASPLTGTSQAQQSYIIQLPLDATNPALQGASYFLYHNYQTITSVLLFEGSALVLPSPVKPMMLPVSVVGPNPVGKVQMVSNQVRSYQQPSSSASRDLSPPAVTQPASQSQSKVTKTPSKTSSLAKQAAEMLQDIQGLKSPSNPVKGLGASSSDLPGTGSKQEAPADCPRTPRQKGKVKDVEGTPKHLMPPNTPDVPGCSPASEAGSESSINMAAHTLMILSRAAIARTGSPLKDSLRQDGIGEKSPTSSKNSKKRKQPISASSPPPKKESKRSPTKKKDRERKKIIDYFPEDLDVDKFLSSLHYDE
uniref:Nuclear protein, ataxia-telangiectasia locus n=1 Tax=Neolamprologus brichardi TaxID=32507 RepID=A0A3Q4G6Y7_NEOBR